MTIGSPVLYTGAVWDDLGRELARDRSTRAHVAIAYLGVDAADLLSGLRAGDVLVCDASDQAVRLGLTSVAALKQLHDRNVVLYSHEGMHSKCAQIGHRVLIGSANASKTSAERRSEAVVALTSPPVAADLRRHVTQLAASPGRRLTAEELDLLAAIPVRAVQFPVKAADSRPVLPPGATVWLMPWDHYTETRQEERESTTVIDTLAPGIARADTVDVVWSSHTDPLREGHYVCWMNPSDRFIGPPHRVKHLQTPARGRHSGIYYVQRGDLRNLPTSQIRDVFGHAWPASGYNHLKVPKHLLPALQNLPWAKSRAHG